MNHKIVCTACAALAMLGGLPAMADSRGSASLTNMQFRLIDLRPNDGIAPSLTFLDGVGSMAELQLHNGTGGSNVQVTATSGGPLQGTMAARMFGAVGARASVRGNGSLLGVGLFANSFANASQPEPDRYAAATSSLSANTYDGLRFELSPHTQLIWTADADVSAHTSQSRWPDPSYPDIPLTEQAYVYAQMRLGTLSSDGHFERAAGYNVGRARAFDLAWIDNGTVGVGQSLSYSSQTSLVMRNRTDESFTGVLSAQVGASNQAASPIPEPETYAMYLAGLAAIGLVVRRRRGRLNT